MNRRRRRDKGDPDDPDDSSDDDAGWNNDRRPKCLPLGPKPQRGSPFRSQRDKQERGVDSRTHRSTTAEPHFDLKLKFNNVPKWDGNTDTITRWFLKINTLAKLSPTVFKQLGTIVPKRFEGSAETWYWSLPISYRAKIEENWDTLRTAIGTYYMNRKWLD